jgi:hypothetical protein
MESGDANVGYRIWGVDNVIYGPVELPVLVNWIQDERVTAQTWVFCEQEGVWQKAAAVPELHMFFREPSAATANSGRSPDAFSPLVPGIKPGALRRVKILADMTDQQLGRFAQVMEVQSVRQFAEIVKQGTTGDAMYLLLDGEVRVRLMIGDKESILTTLAAGDFFGEIALFDRGARSADVVANKDSVLLKVSAATFQKLVSESPDLATPLLFAIGRTLAARIRADDKRYRDSVAFARAAR